MIHGAPTARSAKRGRARDARARRHAARGGRPLPAPVQRRPAPAHRARARARPAAEARRRRRAGLGARRLDPVAGAEPARRAEAGVRPHLRLRRPRPRRRRLHLRPRRRHVPRPDRRDRALRRALRAAAAPVHGGAALGEPGAGARPQEQPHRPQRRRAEPDRPAVRLPLPHPLPDRAGDLRRGRPDAAGPRQRPPRRVPLPRDADLPAPVQPACAPREPSAPGTTSGCCTTSACRCATGSRSRPTSTSRSAAQGLPTIIQWTPYESTRERFISLGRLVRAAAATPRSWSTSAAATSPRATFDGVGASDGVDAYDTRHLGGRRAVVERAHRHLGPELRRARAVAARAPAAPERLLPRAAGDPRRLLLGRLLDGRRLPARAHARRRGAVDERDGADHRPERPRRRPQRPHLRPPAADRARRGRDRPQGRLLAALVGAPGQRRLLAASSATGRRR